MLDTIHVESASQEGMRKCMDEFLRQLELDRTRVRQEPAPQHLIVWVGDQLTVTRFDSSRMTAARISTGSSVSTTYWGSSGSFTLNLLKKHQSSSNITRLQQLLDWSMVYGFSTARVSTLPQWQVVLAISL